MDIPKNYKEIIEKSIPGEWHLLGNRNAPPFLLWLKMLALDSDEMRRIYGTTVKGAVIYKGSFTKFYFLSDTFKGVVQSATGILFSENKAKNQLEQVSVLQDYAKKKAAFFLEEDLRNLSDGELWKKYEEVAACYVRPLLYGFLTWCVPVLTDYAKSILRKHFDKIAGLDVDEKTAFGILVTPHKKSPYSEKNEALDRLAIKYKKQIGEINGDMEDKIKEGCPELDADILEFLAKYKWIGYDYSGPATDYGEVLKDIKERNLDIEKQQRISRNDIIEKCGFSPSEKNVFDIFSQLTYVKDARNSGDDFIHFCLIEYFFAEVGRRFGLNKEAVQFLSPGELEKMLKENKVYSEEYINEKKRCYVATTIDKEGIKKYYAGNEAEKFLNKIEKKIDHSETREFRGTVACIGKVTVRVKIVNTFEELDKIKEGDALVTHMTSPRFISAIKKAGAIITNEGGMTCHAAIISREFKIPCIVGTKIATQVLHDGDLVEVDADNGIVRILNES